MPVGHQAFFHAPSSTVSYLVWDEATRVAAVIDPVLDYEPNVARISTPSADQIIRAAGAHGLTLRYVLETHAHADHLSAADHIRQAAAAQVVIGEKITQIQEHFRKVFGAEDVIPDGRSFDRLVADGDALPLGQTTIHVMHTPGHTPGCVTYVIGDNAFVGDTLFMPDYGTARTDFPGGDAAMLYRSIRRILALPPQTRIFVGHDYLPEGRQSVAWESTVAEQRAHNVQARDSVTEAEFVQRRRARDATLPPPVLMLPALQVNIRAGALPPPDRDGQRYLRLPISFA